MSPRRLLPVIVGILIFSSILGSIISDNFLLDYAIAEESIKVTTNKPIYRSGEFLTVEWIIPSGSPGAVSVVSMVNPDGKLIFIDQTSCCSSQYFIAGPQWEVNGKYTVKVHRGEFSGQTSFIIKDKVEQFHITTTNLNGEKISDANCSVLNFEGELLGEGITKKNGITKIKFPSNRNILLVTCSTETLFAGQYVVRSDHGITKTDLVLFDIGSKISIPLGTSHPGCEQTNSCFIPFLANVAKNEWLIWSNDDTSAHTVTSGSPQTGPDGMFDSSLFLPGVTFSHKFESIGEFPYFCQVHPWMKGIVVVNE